MKTADNKKGWCGAQSVGGLEPGLPSLPRHKGKPAISSWAQVSREMAKNSQWRKYGNGDIFHEKR